MPRPTIVPKKGEHYSHFFSRSGLSEARDLAEGIKGEFVYDMETLIGGREVEIQVEFSAGVACEIICKCPPECCEVLRDLGWEKMLERVDKSGLEYTHFG